MTRQLIIGFVTEGTTDTRFLGSIIQRSFEHIAFECKGQIEILPIQHLIKEPGIEFIESVKSCAKKALNIGVMVLCVHVDADYKNDSIVFRHKFDPIFSEIEYWPQAIYCNNIIAVVPVQMTESWMLSDTTLFKDEIGTNRSEIELGIHKNPETYKDPKEIIKEAIRISRQDETKRRRRNLKIHELYSSIGQKIDLTALENLKSYQKFSNSIRSVYEKLNYL